MAHSLPYLDAACVHQALDFPRLIARLRCAFLSGVTAPVRHVHALSDDQPANRLLLMPAWQAQQSLGVKIVTVFPRNPSRGAATVGACYVLLDPHTGHPLAVLDGEALTLRRTGAVSALATQALARQEARVLTLIGTGQLAPYMAMAHCAVRPIEQIYVWGRNLQRAEALVRQLQRAGFNAQVESQLTQAIARADIISCATTSDTPLVHARDVRPGTHIDLVGGFTPTMREADDALMSTASVFVDTYAGTLKEAGDLVQPIARGTMTRNDLRAELVELLRGDHAGRQAANEITLFKSVGTALVDLAAAQWVYDQQRGA